MFTILGEIYVLPSKPVPMSIIPIITFFLKYFYRFVRLGESRDYSLSLYVRRTPETYKHFLIVS